MAIEILLAGSCVAEAGPKIRAFLEQELASPVLDGTSEHVEVRGKAHDIATLTCAVIQAAAAGVFLADRVYGEQKVSELLVEVRIAAAPEDIVTLRVHGGREIDLTVAKPPAVYSALRRAAETKAGSNRARPTSRARRS